MKFILEQYKYGENSIEYKPYRGFDSLEQATAKFEELSKDKEYVTSLYDENGNTIKRS